MRTQWILVAPFLGALWGCSGQSAIRPVEVLDERTGITWAALREPIELVQGAPSALVAAGKRISFAYLGPVEWNRSGNFSYGLWIHVAPGNDRQIGDIRAAGAVTVILDDGTLVETPMEQPKVGREPYRQVASWGQSAYFALDVQTLARMAASQKLTLEFRAADNSADISVVSFTPTHDTHAALSDYLRGRKVTGD
jgi:hypothetical protein